jgi:hypothetical protein
MSLWLGNHPADKYGVSLHNYGIAYYISCTEDARKAKPAGGCVVVLYRVGVVIVPVVVRKVDVDRNLADCTIHSQDFPTHRYGAY